MTDIFGPNPSPADFVAENGVGVRSIEANDHCVHKWRVCYADGNRETVTIRGRVLEDGGPSDYDLKRRPAPDLPTRIAQLEADLAKLTPLLAELKAQYAKKPALPIEFRREVSGAAAYGGTLSASGAVVVANMLALSPELKYRSLVVKRGWRVELREKDGYTHILIWPKDVE